MPQLFDCHTAYRLHLQPLEKNEYRAVRANSKA